MTNYRCQRHRNVDAIARSSIHQSLVTPSSQIAIARCKSSTLNDPKQALDLIRSLVQNELNEKVQVLMQEYVDSVFQPAIQNIRKNLGDSAAGDNIVGALLLEEVCCNALDHAKDMFRARHKTSSSIVSANDNHNHAGTVTNSTVANNHGLITASMATRIAVKRKLKRSITNNANKRRLLGQRSDLPLVTPDGKPVRREGPKWDAKRINHETQFILGTRACRLLGYKRGSRLYTSHTSLFKYTLDQEDKERLVEANVITNNSGGKVNVLIAEDIVEIADNMELNVGAEEVYRHSFKCPVNMIDKMKIFIDLVKTDPAESDDILLKKVVPVASQDIMDSNNTESAAASVNDLLTDMKNETVSEEDLGFLQGMNLTSLVREFEMEAQGSQHLGILSLTDDVPEHPFSELVPEDQHQSNGNSLNDIEFE